MNAEEKRKKFISLDEIRSLYKKNTSTSVVANPESISDRPAEMTASTRFIVKEAKKIISTLADEAESRNYPGEEELLEIIKTVERAEGEELSARERNAAIVALRTSFDHYDILHTLVQNPEVNDIIVRSYDDVSIQIGRKNIQTDIRFSDHETYSAFIEGLLKRAGKSCTRANPLVDTSIDPHIRANVVHESLCPGSAGPMLTLRISRFHSISVEGLEVLEFAPPEVFEYLKAVVRLGCGAILIGGEVGTGKTTLVRALASAVDESDAILVIEDTNEINLQRKFVRTILTREANLEGAGRITPAQAIRSGMRMAMNRIILGEIRDGEAAEAFVDVCASGHPGMSTVHAKTGRDAVSRMELFLSRAQGKVGIETIRRQISNAISVVVYLGLDSVSKRRRIISVHEVDSSIDGAVQMSPIYELHEDYQQIFWKRGQGVSQYQNMFADIGLMISMPGATLYGGRRSS